MKRANMTYPYEIAALILAHLRGELDEAARESLKVWIQESPEHEKLFSRICDERMQYEEIRKMLLKNVDGAWCMVAKKTKARRRIRMFKVYGAVASVVLLLGVSASLWLKYPKENEQIPESESKEILHGRSIAKLISASGVAYRLDTLSSVALSAVVVQSDGQRAVFQESEHVHDSSAIRFNTIEIPCGGEYKIVLTDGTVVYLNSETKFSFPESFVNAEERVVYLYEGEAFFEVSKHEDKPFIVKCDDYAVKVLGTSFNVSNYPDDLVSKTTLASGKVEVSAAGKKVVLKPGEQAQIQGNQVQVNTVDVEVYTTWMDASFRFKGESIAEIMKRIARWYAVEVFYSNENLKERHFSGYLPRYAKIADVLDLLSLTTNICFEIKGNVVKVKEK